MKKRLDLVYGCITILIWSFAFLFTQYASDSFSWKAAVFYRYFFASVGLLAIMAVKRTKLPKRRDLPKFLLAGLFGFALFGIVYNIASHTTTSAVCGVTGQLNPVVTAILASAILKEKIRPKGWLAIAISFSGALVVFLWNGLFSITLGALMLLVATVLLSIYNLLQRMYVKDYSPFESTAYSMIGGTIFLLIFAPQAVSEIGGAAPKAWVSVIMLGFVCSALAYVLWSKALEQAERTSDVTNLMFASPFITSIIGFFGRGEIPGIEIYLGAVLVITGLVLFQKWK